jgi:hypothetical protein
VGNKLKKTELYKGLTGSIDFIYSLSLLRWLKLGNMRVAGHGECMEEQQI